jgi:hypothetical protein
MVPLKPLIELSVANHESLLKYAIENSRLYLGLESAVKTEANTIEIPCELDEAEWLRGVAKLCCPDAVPQIEKAIRESQVPT